MIEYRISKNAKYGYLCLDPIPSVEEVNKYYEQEFYAQQRPSVNDSQLDLQNEEKDFFNLRFEDIYKSGIEFFKREDYSVFDIGFGYAQQLLYLRERGISVSGLEPTKEGYEYALEQGLPVYKCNIENICSLPDEKYDFVTMLNVLEHLREPALALIDIKEHLIKKNGLLMIDVPNEFNDFQVVANDEYDLNEWWIAAPAHINYFSADSLSKLLEMCGYRVWKKESSFPLEMFILFGDVYVGNNELGRLCHNKRVNFEMLMRKHGKEEKLHSFYQALAELNLGRQIVIYATPI